MALALMCKEMAMVLPAVFGAYEFIIGSKDLKIWNKCLFVLKKNMAILVFIMPLFRCALLCAGNPDWWL